MQVSNPSISYALLEQQLIDQDDLLEKVAAYNDQIALLDERNKELESELVQLEGREKIATELHMGKLKIVIEKIKQLSNELLQLQPQKESLKGRVQEIIGSVQAAEKQEAVALADEVKQRFDLYKEEKEAELRIYDQTQATALKTAVEKQQAYLQVECNKLSIVQEEGNRKINAVFEAKKHAVAEELQRDVRHALVQKRNEIFGRLPAVPDYSPDFIKHQGYLEGRKQSRELLEKLGG